MIELFYLCFGFLAASFFIGGGGPWATVGWIIWILMVLRIFRRLVVLLVESITENSGIGVNHFEREGPL